jgi:hypothetical protein
MPSVSEHALARLYNHRSYSDPAEIIEDYERVMNYCAEHPNAGRTKVGNTLELPPERVRGWMNGGKPDPVRAIDVAHAHGWLDPDAETMAALNRLVALVFAAGSIGSNYVPAFTPEDEPTATDALDELGVRWTRRNEDAETRATEVVPSEDAPVLGRVLVLFGAPQGEKNADSRLHLPDYLDGADEGLRRDFAEVVVRNRRADNEGWNVVNVREERSDAYLDELAAFLSDVLDVDVTRSDKNLYLQEDPL